MQQMSMPCLMCDAPVVVDKEEWESTEAPFALCDGCSDLVDRGVVAWPMVRMLYVIRCQVGALLTKMDLVEKNIKRLFSAQQDMEQELMGRRKSA